MKLALVAALVSTCWLTCAARADFLVVEKGANPAPVIVAADASAATIEAAQELVSYIEKSSGAKPALITGDPSPTPERAVWVGMHPALGRVLPKLKLEFSYPEEILIAVQDKHVVIAGRDRVVGKQQTEYGTANAVYTFLQRNLGVRWLWPGPLGEDLVRRETIRLKAEEYRFHPVFRQRLFWPQSPKEWHRRQRLLLSSYRFEGGHAFTDWWERYHASHPEYFALQPNGKREPAKDPKDVKLCLSCPGVVEQWLTNAEGALRADPAKLMASATPNDSGGFCVCENCRAWNHPEAPPGVLTDQHVKFWNQLARRLQTRFPDREVQVGVYAYSAYRTPPIAEVLEKNVPVGYVGHFPLAGDEVTGREKEAWRAWAQMATSIVFRPNLFHYSGGPLGLPTVALRRTIVDFGFLADHKCVGLEIDTLPMCWATQGPQYYLMAQLAYDPYENGHRVLDDYYRRGFGTAAEEIQKYFAAWDDAHEAILQRIKHSSGWAHEAVAVYRDIYTPARLVAADVLLRRAEGKVAGGPKLYQERVAFIRTGFEFVKLQMEIMDVMAAVRQSKGANTAAVKKAIELCAARDALIKASGGVAVRHARWYYQTRRMEDYLGPPAEKYRGPLTGGRG